MRSPVSVVALLVGLLAGCRAREPAQSPDASSEPAGALDSASSPEPPDDAPGPAPLAESADPPVPASAPDEEPAPAPVSTAEVPPDLPGETEPTSRPFPDRPPIERFVGTFAYAGGEAQRKAALEAIDAALAELDVISRSLARRKLAARDPVIARITIEFSAGKTAILREGTTVRAVLDGAAATVTRDGRSAKVKHRLADATRLVETIRTERGVTTNTFALSEDGTRLTVSTHIESERLKAPIRYRLTYRRQ